MTSGAEEAATLVVAALNTDVISVGVRALVDVGVAGHAREDFEVAEEDATPAPVSR